MENLSCSNCFPLLQTPAMTSPIRRYILPYSIIPLRGWQHVPALVPWTCGYTDRSSWLFAVLGKLLKLLSFYFHLCQVEAKYSLICRTSEWEKNECYESTPAPHIFVSHPRGLCLDWRVTHISSPALDPQPYCHLASGLSTHRNWFFQQIDVSVAELVFCLFKAVSSPPDFWCFGIHFCFSFFENLFSHWCCFYMSNAEYSGSLVCGASPQSSPTSQCEPSHRIHYIFPLALVALLSVDSWLLCFPDPFSRAYRLCLWQPHIHASLLRAVQTEGWCWSSLNSPLRTRHRSVRLYSKHSPLLSHVHGTMPDSGKSTEWVPIKCLLTEYLFF